MQISALPILLRIWIAAIFFAAGTVSVWAQGAASETVRVSKPAILEIWNRPVVEFRASIGNTTPSQRVANSKRRIDALPDEDLTKKIQASPAKIGTLTGLLITVDSHILFGLVPQDVDPESGKTLTQVGQEASTRLQQALRAKAVQTRPAVIMRGIGLTVIASVVYIVLLWLIAYLRRRAYKRIAAEPVSGHLALFGLDVLPLLATLKRGLAKLTAFGLAVVITYLWLTFVLSQFPYSQPWGESMGVYLTDRLRQIASSTVHAIPKLFTILVIYLLTRLITEAVSATFKAIEAEKVAVTWLDPLTAKATRRLVVVFIWIIALAIAYPYIPGSDTYAFKGISVILGVMASLGSAGLVNQLMSGLAVVYSRTFKLGDYVRVGEAEGRITHMGPLAAKITVGGNEEVSVPNAVLTGTSVTNYSRLATGEDYLAVTSVTIGYDTPWRQVHALLLLAVQRTPGLRDQPRPLVLQEALSDFFVKYTLHAHFDGSTERFKLMSELHARIQDAFNEYEVQIMSPHFVMQPETNVYVPKSRWQPPPASGVVNDINPPPTD